MAPRTGKPDTTFDNGSTDDTSTPETLGQAIASQTPDQPATATEAASTAETAAAPTPATAGTVPDPQRVIIEQAPAEPAVFYGEDALVPGTARATDPNKPHVKAHYEPFQW